VKPCVKCGVPKAAKTRCAPCKLASAAAYRDKHREKLRLQSAAHLANNLEKERARKRKYKTEDPERNKAQSDAYRERHRDRINATFREKHAANPEKENARSRNRYAKDPAKVIARTSKRQKENPDKSCAYSAKNRAKYPGRAAAALRKRRSDNPEEARLRDAVWRAKNLESTRAYGARYAKKYPGKMRAKNAKRYARLRGAVGSHTEAEWDAKRESQGFRCIDCGMLEGEKYKNGKRMTLTRGHGIPVTPRKGSGFGPGPDYIWNIIAQCHLCNGKQGNHFVHPAVIRLMLGDLFV
jgi:hypothetical protein